MEAAAASRRPTGSRKVARGRSSGPTSVQRGKRRTTIHDFYPTYPRTGRSLSRGQAAWGHGEITAAEDSPAMPVRIDSLDPDSIYNPAASQPPRSNRLNLPPPEPATTASRMLHTVQLGRRLGAAAHRPERAPAGTEAITRSPTCAETASLASAG